VDPAPTGFQSLVNGHVLREGEWHYWSTGIPGWVSGETFLLDDAIFLRAALALEDWRDATSPQDTVPYDVRRPRSFDTTHLDRAGTKRRFDDPDVTDWAQAQRLATDFAVGKGYRGARLTGHHLGERVGLVCLPASITTFIDVADQELAATAFPFSGINTTNWAQIGRAAMEIAANHGQGAGYFTGHQLPDGHGWIGLRPDAVTVLDVANDDPAVVATPWRFDDVNTVAWAQAARLANDVCHDRGFAGGFFTGHQLHDRRQVVGVHSS
jgi:hypothetical protein